MEFPVIIEDLPQMKRLIRSIAREAAQEVTKGVTPEQKKSFLKKQHCYREAGSRELVDRAFKNGNLKMRTKEGMRGIPRKEFEDWKNKTIPDGYKKRLGSISV